MTNRPAEPSRTARLPIVRSAMFGHAIADAMGVARRVFDSKPAPVRSCHRVPRVWRTRCSGWNLVGRYQYGAGDDRQSGAWP